VVTLRPKGPVEFVVRHREPPSKRGSTKKAADGIAAE
jgi:hypothetical protein